MIKIENLTKKFGNKVVFEDINFDVPKGGVVGIIGPSGAGKSTILRCLNLLEKPQEGLLRIDDEVYSLADASPAETLALRRQMAMVFQSFNLFHKKTALENVTEGLIVVHQLDKDKAVAIAEEELAKVGMLQYKNHYPKHLSGGQQQRVAIARATALQPKLLLFDEPTSALDPELIGEVLNVIQAIANDEYTMIIVSHEMGFIKKISDQILFLDDQTIYKKGTPEEIFDDESDQRITDFLATYRANQL